MRFWLAGPRLFGGMIRPGVSFGGYGGFARRAPAPPPIGGDWIYVIEGAHGNVKIGRSRDPSARFANLQTASPYPLKLAFTAWTPDDAFPIEQEAHALLAAHRLNGEWFDTSKELAIASVYGAASRLGRGLGDTPQYQRPPDSARGKRALWIAVAIMAFLAMLIKIRGG